MRTGAIFARGSCRALKWMALAGMVFALGAGSAAAQSTGVTITGPSMGTVDEGGTAMYTVAVKGYVDAAVDEDNPTAANTVTVSLATPSPATTDPATTHGESTDLNSNLHVLSVSFDTPENESVEDPLLFEESMTISVATVHDRDAEDERFSLTFSLDADGGLDTTAAADVAITLPTGAALPNELKIDDDEEQVYLLTEDDPGDAKEGSDAIELTLKTRYPIEDSSVTLTLGHDGGSGWTLDTTPSEPADTDPTVEVTVVHSAPGDTAVPEDFSQEVTLTGPANDKNRRPDTVTVTMYSGGVTDRMMQGSLGVVIADVHALPARSAITAMAYDAMTGGNMVTSPVEAGDTVYLVVEVDRGADDYPMDEDLEVALSLSDASLATLGNDEVTVGTGGGKQTSDPRVSLEVGASNMINPETLMVNLNAKGADDTANGPSGDGVMGMPLSLMITQPDGNEPRITAKSKPMVDAAVDAAMMAGAGDDGFNPGEMFELDPNDLFDVVDGYMLELSSVDSSNTAKVGAGAINGMARIEATADGNADVTITARATMGSSSATIVDQILLDEAQIIVPVSVVLAPGPDPVAPSAPQNLMAAAGDGQVMLSWEAPATGDPPTGYQYRVTVAGVMGGWTDTSSATMLEETVTGLINETEYTFHVRAGNVAGYSLESNAAMATPMAVIPPVAPGKPENLMAAPGDTKVELTWDEPTTGDPPTAYRYRASVAGAEGSWSVTQDTSATVTGLANGTEYTFEVVAFNDAGASEPATVTETPMADPVPEAPSAPQNLTARAGDAQVMLAWMAPASGDAPTGYQYRVTVAGVMGEWMDTSSATMLEETVTGLTNGTEYTFHVRAMNAAGNSLESNAAMATPMAVIPPVAPGMPQNLMADPGDTQVDLTWDAPATGDTPTGYRYRASVPGAEGSWSVTTATSATVTGLANGTEYTFEVVAFNDAGASEPATVTETPMADPVPVAPSAPQSLAAAVGDEHVVLTWTAPASGDTPTGYQYRVTGAGVTGDWMAASSPQRVSGLVNGTEYTFEVRAMNAAGNGPPASETATPMAPVEPVAPSAPQNLTATAGDKQVVLAWTAPASGDTPTGYEYRQSAGGISSDWMATSSATGQTVTDLTNGTEYTFEVRAMNAAGAGPPASETATPMAPVDPVAPSAPQDLTAAAGDKQVVLAWTAPASGDTPTGYEYHVMGAGVSGDWMATSSMTGHTVTGLTNGTEYTFQVRAMNAAGPGPAASAKATPMAPDPGVQVTVKEVKAATSVAESGGLEVTVVATVPAGTKVNDKVAPIASRTVMVSFPTDDASILAGEDADAGELTPLGATGGAYTWTNIKRTDKASEQTYKFRVAVGQDLDAEDEKFQVEVRIDGASKKSKVVTIDDAQEQTYVLSLPSAAKGAIKEGAAAATLTLKADPARTIDIPAALVLNPNDPSKYKLGALSSNVFGINAVTASISAEADDNRVDDTITVTAYSGVLGAQAEIASLDITVTDVNALPAVKATIVDDKGKALSPQPESVMEGETVKVMLTAVDKDGKAMKAAEKLTITLMPTGTADAQDYRLSSQSFEIAKDKESSAAVDLMVTENQDVGEETLMFDAAVAGESKIGTEKRSVAGVLSLMITDGTDKLVWANSQEDVEAAVYAAKNAGAGDDMTFTEGEMIEVVGALLFSSAPGVSVSYTAESSMSGVASTSVGGGTVMVTAVSEGMADITITAHASMSSGVKILDQNDPGMASVMFPVEVGLEALSIMLSGPEDMNLAEGMSAMVTATANRPVSADTTVMLMRDRAQSSAGDADYTAEAITIAAGSDMGSTMVMAIEDNMAEDMEELVLYGMTEGMAGEVTGEVKLYLWDAAVPALPVIAQLLLAAFLAVGGYRRYRRR